VVWSTVLLISVLYSLILFAAFSGLLVVGGLISNDAMLHDYPPAIQERHGPKTPRGARTTMGLSIVTVLLLIGASIAGVAVLRDQLGGDIGFWPAFVFGTVAFFVFNLLDLLVLDWWLFCRVQPRFLVPESTRGMAEYRDFSFHWKVLIPKPVPWPLLLIPGYGVILGGATLLWEALR